MKIHPSVGTILIVCLILTVGFFVYEYRVIPTNNHMYTPLMIAINSGNIAEAIILIDSSVDVNATDDMGHSALFNALSINNYELITKLLDHGADPLIRGLWGDNILHYAAMCDHVNPRILELLIAKGVNVNAPMPNKPGTEPLFKIAAKKRYDEVKVLLAHGADPTITINGVNVFTLARDTNDKALIDILEPYKHLLEGRGSDVHSKEGQKE